MSETRIELGRYFLVLWRPSLSLKPDCIGVWAATTIVWRADCWHAYQWSFGIRVVGFGVGLARKPNDEASQ